MNGITENMLVPIILVVGGLLFLLFALSRCLAFVEISAHLRRLSAILGAFLLFTGVGLYAFTTLLSFLSSLRQSESPTSLPTVSPTSTLTAGEIESMLQAEINVVATEVAQIGLTTSPEGNGMQTATFASLMLSQPANLRATAAARLTKTQQAMAAEATRNAIPTLTKRAVDQTATAKIWTATPSSTPSATVTPSITPLPTSTPFPTSTILQANAEVLFRDEFNRDRLSFANWRSNGIEPILTNDRLIFEGVNRWGDSIVRAGITENEGVFLLFQHTTGEMELYLEKGEFGESDYRRWSFVRHGSEWEAGSMHGDDYTVYESARLREATWHYLLLRVGSDGHLYTQVWEADDPSGFNANVDVIPEGEGWDNDQWHFVIQVHSGTLELEFYEDIRFPKEYQSLGAPPQLTPAA